MKSLPSYFSTQPMPLCLHVGSHECNQIVQKNDFPPEDLTIQTVIFIASPDTDRGKYSRVNT